MAKAKKINQGSELKQQIELVCIERGLDQEEVIKAMEIAIASAYRKEFGDKEKLYEAEFDLDNGKYIVYETFNIVDEVLSPAKEVSVVEARLSDTSAKVGDVIRNKVEDERNVAFGRIATQVAKQVLVQAISNVRHTKVLKRFKDKIGDVVNVEVDYFRKGGYVVKLAQTTGYIGKEHLSPVDRFKPGQMIKALIVDIIEDDRKGSRVILSRTAPEFVTAIIKQEVPEVESDVVLIKKVVREPGSRSKIMVAVNEDENQDIDPVGTILGRRNVRILNIMREISTSLQEKVDVVEYQSDNLEEMIMDALEPAEIEDIEFTKNEEGEEIVNVYCYAEDASLAVGKRGVNVRLASDLLDLNIKVHTIEGESEEKGPEILVE